MRDSWRGWFGASRHAMEPQGKVGLQSAPRRTAVQLLLGLAHSRWGTALAPAPGCSIRLLPARAVLFLTPSKASQGISCGARVS